MKVLIIDAKTDWAKTFIGSAGELNERDNMIDFRTNTDTEWRSASFFTYRIIDTGEIVPFK
jgi:hypothetical protein